MMAYQSDMYMQSYGGNEDWSWQQGQSWGNGYEQLPYDQSQYDQSQYDCSGCGQGWDYQQQGWGSAAEQPGQASEAWGHAGSTEMPATQASVGLAWSHEAAPEHTAAHTWGSAGVADGEVAPSQRTSAQQSTAKAEVAGQALAAQSSHSWSASAGDAPATSSAASQAQAASGSKETLPPSPKAGAELLTELRLAELKRLIDRDAQALRQTVPEAEVAAKEKVAPDGAPEDSDSQGGTTRAPESTEDTPVKGELAVAAAAWRGERRRAKEKAQEASAGPPGLAAPAEQQCRLVLVDFAPESRTYGEMPVRAGEEVLISYAPVEDWIFGWKDGPAADKGWLPAQCLGIGVSLSDAETSEGEDDHDRQLSSGRGRGGRGRGGKDGTAGAGAVSSSSGRKAAARAEKESQQQKVADDDAEAWHHHGNWWSRQRHLKTESSAPPPDAKAAPAVQKDLGDSRRRGQAEVEEQRTKPASQQRPVRQLPPAAAAAVAAATADKAPASAKGAGRGKGGRERPALSSLLDRLNKPLVAPKPVTDNK